MNNKHQIYRSISSLQWLSCWDSVNEKNPSLLIQWHGRIFQFPKMHSMTNTNHNTWSIKLATSHWRVWELLRTHRYSCWVYYLKPPLPLLFLSDYFKSALCWGLAKNESCLHDTKFVLPTCNNKWIHKSICNFFFSISF